MTKKPARLLIAAAITALLVLVGGRLFAQLYTELLWFDRLGYTAAWWKRVGAGAAVRLGTATFAALAILLSMSRVVRYLGPVQLRRRYGNLEFAEQIPRVYIQTGLGAIAVLAGWWLSATSFPASAITDFLAFLNRGSWGVQDPIFGLDLGFYVFTLPVLRRTLAFFMMIVVWSAMLVMVGYALVGAVRLRQGRLEIDVLPRLHFAVLGAAVLVLIALQFWISRYQLLTGGTGFGGITGFTDVNARLLARALMAVACMGAAVVVGISASRRAWAPALAALGSLLLVGVVVGIAYPSLVQRLRVVPNELEREAPWLAHSIEFTRLGFGLAEVQREPLLLRDGPGARELEPRTGRQPLWDEGPLQAAFNQMQALRGYYQFPSVHVDRYGPGGEETPVAISVREFTPGGLPADARTWRTLHLNVDQVRGNGAVVTPAAAKTSEGNPVFWLRGVDPVQRSEDAPVDIELRDPAVLFGETTSDWLIQTPAEGVPDSVAGIRLGSFFRLLAFAWRLGDGNLLFSGELTDDSRILLRRRVVERVAALAPFMAWNSTPHPVIAGGRIVWVLDGFSVSAEFPLARSFPLEGIGSVRYVRNSVKATVDALTGAVRLWALDPEEPLLAAWSRVFPGLFASLDVMPDEIRRHLVYPRNLLHLQARVLQEYHVEEPAAFFSGENAWQIPLEPGPASVGREYQPIPVLGPGDGDGRSAFLLVVPFIARERQNMTALLAVENDGDRYGRLVLRELPVEAQVTGPRQVGTLIEQDPTISAQLTLWRQGGSDVELGRLRVLPMDGWILYVQPIFLLGSGGSIPQLQRVVASDGTIVAMGQTLAEATAGLVRRDTLATGPPVEEHSPDVWGTRAWEMFQDAERSLREGDWPGFGRQWTELRALLERAARAGRGS